MLPDAAPLPMQRLEQLAKAAQGAGVKVLFGQE